MPQDPVPSRRVVQYEFVADAQIFVVERVRVARRPVVGAGLRISGQPVVDVALNTEVPGSAQVIVHDERALAVAARAVATAVALVLGDPDGEKERPAVELLLRVAEDAAGG